MPTELRNTKQNGWFIYESCPGEQKGMSWLQSSLGFAKTAISQAQKSIDKVLDINEDHDVLSEGINVLHYLTDHGESLFI